MEKNILVEALIAFGSSGGKSRIAHKIVNYFPEHKTYVEAFVGGASVLMAKKKSEIEIINDKDFQIYNSLKVIQSCSIAKIKAAANKKNWMLDEDRIREAWKSKRSGISGYLDFLYGHRHSYSRNRRSISKERKNNKQPNFNRIVEAQKRLQNVKIFNRDYKSMKIYDSKDTFFYFDPPYPGEWDGPKTDFDMKEFVDLICSLQGKFLVSMNIENRSAFEDKGFKFKKVKIIRTFSHNESKKRYEFELIIANFDLDKVFKENISRKSKELKEFKKEGYNPEKVTDAQLRDDWRLVLAKYSTMIDGGKTEFESLEELESFARILLREILNRGSEVLKFHPENMKDTSLELLKKILSLEIDSRILLPPPHSEYIYDDEKSAIVKAREYYLKKFFILNNGKKSYGYIRFSDGEKGDLKDFEKREEKHKVTDKERIKWWPDKKVFYFYDIVDFIPFEEPIEDKAPRGAQTFWTGKMLKEYLTPEFDIERYEPFELEAISNRELIARHGELHDKWKERGSLEADELVINAHKFIVAELKKRSLEHRFEDDLDKLLDSYEGIKSLQDKPFKINEVLKLFDTDICLKKPFLAFVGGTVVSGRGNDIDIWMNWDNKMNDVYTQRFLHQIEFRLNSYLPPEYKGHIHLIPEPEGKFTNFVPLADLHIKFIPPSERDVFQMSIQEQVPRAASEEIIKQYEKSIEEDKIKLFRFFLPQKPTRAAKPEKRMTLDFYISLFQDEDFPVLSSKKYDGMAIEIHIDNEKGKAVIWSEEGEELTEKLPRTIEALRKLKIKNAVFLAELEYWENDKHLPRESVAGYVHKKEVTEDSPLVSNIFTCLFLDDEDLHNKTEGERQEILKKINFPQSTFDIPDTKLKLNLAPNLVSNNRGELIKNAKEVSNKLASEGDVGKKANAQFFLDGKSRDGWIKYHKNDLIFGEVIERVDTKVPTVFNYRYGIQKGKYKTKEEETFNNLVEVGKSFNTEKKLNAGDMIAIEFETFNFVSDENDDTLSVSAWVPRFIPLEHVEEKVPSEIDDIDSVTNKAKQQGILQRKTITKDGETLYESVQREEKRNLEEYPKNYGILVNHFRGKSVHLDFRRKQNGFLEGETILHQPSGLIDEDVNTLAKGEKWNKILLEKGKFRPDMDPNKKVVIVPKETHPLDWLNVREDVFPPGSVGATRFTEGVFITADEGMVYPGTQKPYFKEFFLDMKKFKGRMVERIIGVGEEWESPPAGVELQWQAWTNLKNQTPYLLSRRGRERREDVPPNMVSWLPPEWEKKIPTDMRWWEKELDKEEKLSRMDKAYNFLVEKGELEEKALELQEAKANFALRYHWWKGAKVIRDMPARGSHYDLLIDSGKKFLDEWNMLDNPLVEEKTVSRRSIINAKTPTGEEFRQWLNFEGAIAPKDAELIGVKVVKKLEGNKYLVRDERGNDSETKETFAEFNEGQNAWIDQRGNIYTGNLKGETYGNPNERIPAYMEIIDRGKAEIIEEGKDFVSLQLDGKKLKGYYTFKTETPGSDIWIFQKSSLPGEPLEEGIIDVNKIKTRSLIVTFGERKYQMIKTRAGKLRLDILR